MGKTISPGAESVVDKDDFDYLLGNGSQPHTWNDFYELMRKERELGEIHCPHASLLALQLLTPRLKQLPFNSVRTDSETINDVIQQAYIVIAENIAAYDENKGCSFPTYIEKWMQGLARDVRNDGASEYQIKHKGFRVISKDAIINQNSDEKSDPIDFEDSHSAVEDIIERKDKERSSRLLRNMLGTSLEPQTEEEKRATYVNTAVYAKFLGGYNNLPEGIRENLEEMVLG
jgi:hypothetical protein